MAAGVPFVASAVGMNKNLADNNSVGYAVKNTEDFKKRLAQLLTDDVKRQTMGKAAAKAVENKYSISAICKNLSLKLKESIST